MFKTLKLKTFRPIFIGSGDELIEPFEVFFSKKEGKVYTDYEDQLLEIPINKLKDMLRFSKYNDRVGAVKGIIKDYVDFKKAHSYDAYFFSSEEEGTAREVHKHISVNGKLYIPGSTLKGVINTAFEYGFKEVKRGGYVEFVPYRKKKERADPLIIRDSNPTQIRIFCESNNVKINPSKRTRRAPPLGLFEMIDEGVELKIKVKFDKFRKSNYNPYGVNSLEEIFEKVDDYIKNQIKRELDVLNTAQWKNKEVEAIIRDLKEFLSRDGYHLVLGAETQLFYKVFPDSNALKKTKKSIDLFIGKRGVFKAGLVMASFDQS